MDNIIRTHLSALYDNLMQGNLTRIIEPYSRVEIDHVAAMVKQPRHNVEQKLSQMILDKVIYGVLDQGAGCLVIYEEPVPDVCPRSRVPKCSTDLFFSTRKYTRQR